MVFAYQPRLYRGRRNAVAAEEQDAAAQSFVKVPFDTELRSVNGKGKRGKYYISCAYMWHPYRL